MNTNIFGLWYGGASYANGDLDRDLETFDSVETACIEADNRYRTGGHFKNIFRFADGREEYQLTPAVDESSELHIWYSDPRGERDPYPECRIRYDADTDEFVSDPA